jgi:hypothetical protein
VHSSLGADKHHAYAPSELTYLIRSGFDYWALGHVHVRQDLSVNPPVVYAGSLLGRTHTDTGPRGALLVDLSDREAPEISFRALAPIRWETITVDHLEGADSLDRLEQRIEAAWRTFSEGQEPTANAEWMIRVRLAGPCPLWKELQDEENRDVLARELTEVLAALDVVVIADRIHPVIPIDDHRVRTDVLGATLRLVESVRRGEQRVITLAHGSLGGVTSQDPAVVDAYVRELLQDADGELAARLLGSEGETS